jgi:hypothetical protein
MSHLDWAPTLLAAAGIPDIKGKLRKGHQAGAKRFRAHLDGYDFLPLLTGATKKGPRREFLYFNDDGLLVGTRVGDWKAVFAEQRSRRFDVWREPFVFLRIPKIFHLRRDPYERADTDSNMYNEWWVDRVPRIFEAQAVVAQFLGSLRQFPPSQRPATFTIDQVFGNVMRQLEQRVREGLRQLGGFVRQGLAAVAHPHGEGQRIPVGGELISDDTVQRARDRIPVGPGQGGSVQQGQEQVGARAGRAAHLSDSVVDPAGQAACGLFALAAKGQRSGGDRGVHALDHACQLVDGDEGQTGGTARGAQGVLVGCGGHAGSPTRRSTTGIPSRLGLRTPARFDTRLSFRREPGKLAGGGGA